MMLKRAAVCAAMVLIFSMPAMAKMRSERDRLRAEAEHACYNDAQALCHDAIPDEDKVTACMKVNRAQLSPACGKIFDRGMKM